MAFDRAYYDLLKSKGLCPHCKGPAAKGRVYCAACSRRITDASKKTATKRQTRWRRKRIRAGLCAYCGKNPLENNLKTLRRLSYCSKCKRRRSRQAAVNYRLCHPGIKTIRCGFCREPGHQRPTCERLIEAQVRQESIERATSRTGGGW